jgi:hypothetical protein
MTEVPGAIVQSALAVYAREAYCDGEPIEGDERVIRCVLEAAAPAMADHVAQAILKHADENGPQKGKLGHYAWRRHFGIAAQVAVFAFSTPEDIRRDTAAALNRGDYMACYLDDAGKSVAGERED